MMKWLIAILAFLYLILPMDLFPDLIAGLGWVDDLILLGVLWYLFFKRPKPQVDRGERAQGTESETNGPRSRASGSGPFEDQAQSAEDPFAILGVPRNASQKEIRTAYRRLAARYHPDKLTHLGEEFQSLAERKFKAIQTAYDALRQRR